MRKINRFVCITLAAVLMCGCSKQEVVRPALIDSVNAGVDVALVERRALKDIAAYDAAILPSSEELSFDIDGYIRGVYVEPGQHVEEGEVIAALVGKNYGAIASLEEEIQELKEENEKNFKYLDAELELEKLSGGNVKETELRVKHEKELAELKLSEKIDRLNLMKENDIGYTYITAPRDCTVMAITSVRAGGYLSAGTPVCALEADGEFTLTCKFMSEKSVAKLHEYYALINGEKYDIDYKPYDKEELKLLSANNIDPVSVFKFSSSTEKLYPGQYATVIAVSNATDEVLVVPVNAVYTDNAVKYVYKVENNVKVKQTVSIGISNATYIEIVDGLKEGDSVYVKN